MKKNEKREWKRFYEMVTVIIIKPLPEDKRQINQFMTLNLSENGVFVICEEMEVLKIGETYEGILDVESKHYSIPFMVIRKTKIIDKDDIITESGYGLMFINPSIEMINEIKIFIQKKKAQKYE